MAELLTIAGLVLVLYLVVRALSGLVAHLGGARHRPYRLLARQYGGRCEARGLIDPPTVSFERHGSSWRVGLAPVVVGQPTAPRTRVVGRFGRGVPLRLELQPRARPTPPQPPRGTRTVELGQPAFDRTYLVQANDPDIARALLAQPEVQRALDDLRSLAPPAGMLLSINPERILTQVDRNLGTRLTLLLGAVTRTEALHQALLRGLADQVGRGVSILAVESASAEVGPPICEVCGEPITAAHVVCAQCRTPCHADCWGFVGGCSTFGCSGKQSVPAPASTAAG